MTDETKECACCSRAPKWKQDFPIEWEGDHYVTRREMVKFMTLGSLLLAGANWITAIGRQAPPSWFESRALYRGGFSAGADRLFALPLSH